MHPDDASAPVPAEIGHARTLCNQRNPDASRLRFKSFTTIQAVSKLEARQKPQKVKPSNCKDFAAAAVREAQKAANSL
jgi:hypothetical protein